MNLKETILTAARADAIPAGEAGPWTVVKWDAGDNFTGMYQGRRVTVSPGHYTSLMRYRMATLHNTVGGECVMNDTPTELATHLDFMLRARGRVLKTGLGLGCVTRGLLANPAVKFVVVIERDPHVLQLVAPHMPRERLQIIAADALDWCEKNQGHFDCAWHDIWSDPDQDEPHLHVSHGKLLGAMRDKVKFQGAWQFPRMFRRAWSELKAI